MVPLDWILTPIYRDALEVGTRLRENTLKKLHFSCLPKVNKMPLFYQISQKLRPAFKASLSTVNEVMISVFGTQYFLWSQPNSLQLNGLMTTNCDRPFMICDNLNKFHDFDEFVARDISFFKLN